ncbi:hypothetical protein [Winogradskyella immobilis]|uniref:Uncharacterized protein n=1 Tax=Winogradskyella immobilis TaxID=2816852 RepID=A0ABS8EK00_9FLAO|nr:hypothetical protein [Winogradskyella immobilis]MCC1483533.1 hypothetical protein [Winogradskyella immobilis]MCG0015627.1 hypothetical protein [Winogradskyella immobilis]
MNIIQKLKGCNPYDLLLILSFMLILIKGLEYVFIGILYPLVISAILLSPFVYCYFKKRCTISKTIKYWSLLILCYGVVRILLNTIIYIDSRGIPSEAYYQFTLKYSIISILYVVIGVTLFRKRKHIFLNLSQ